MHVSEDISHCPSKFSRSMLSTENIIATRFECLAQQNDVNAETSLEVISALSIRVHVHGNTTTQTTNEWKHPPPMSGTTQNHPVSGCGKYYHERWVGGE